jgi:protein-S-isoprenylcysteine O-methyltransferase Ste14
MTTPSRRERSRPLELVGLSAVLALFAGLVVFMSTRELVLALIFLGIAFIVALVVLAMLALAVRPTGEEQLDLDEQDRGQDGPKGH